MNNLISVLSQVLQDKLFHREKVEVLRKVILNPDNHGGHLDISINGVAKRLKTGVELHLTDAEYHVLLNANIID